METVTGPLTWVSAHLVDREIGLASSVKYMEDELRAVTDGTQFAMQKGFSAQEIREAADTVFPTRVPITSGKAGAINLLARSRDSAAF